MNVKRLSPNEAAELCIKIAEALHHAHEAGVIHRDLKPGNIMMDEEGQPHIVDFGLAKRDAGEITMTVEGQILGTPAYMPPEQARGEGHGVNRRADIYSLGVVLYELLTGELPFRGDKRMLIMQILRDEPRPPRNFNSSVPRDLETICLRCLEKSPERRFPTADELRAELKRFVDGEPIESRKITSMDRAWRWCKRNPALAGMTAAVWLVLIVGLSATIWQWIRAEQNAVLAGGQAAQAKLLAQRERQAKNEARRILYIADMNVAAADWEAANIPRMRNILERHIPQPGETDLRGFEWYLWWRLSHGYRQAIKAHEDNVTSLAFSAEGLLASSSRDGTVKVWDVNSGTLQTTHREHSGGVKCVAFSPDGLMLASGDRESSVVLWSMATGETYKEFPGHEGHVNSVAFSPDGKTLATGSHEIKLWDIASGTCQTLESPRPRRDSTVLAFSPDGHRLAVGGENADRIKIVDVKTREIELEFPGLDRVKKSLAFSPDGNTLAVGEHTFAGILRDPKLILWNLASGKQRHLECPKSGVSSFAFSPNGNYLAAAGNLGQIVALWDLRSGSSEPVAEFKGHAGTVRTVGFSPDGRTLASGGHDGTIKLWPIEGNPPVSTFRGRPGERHSVAFSPDGRTLASVASGSADNSVILWDVATGNAKETLKGHKNGIGSVAFSPNGKYLASASQDKTVILWGIGDAKPKRVFSDHTSNVQSVAFSPDGQTLASGDSRGIVVLRQLETGEILHTLRMHGSTVVSVSFSQDGSTIAAARWDRAVKSWDVRTGELKSELFPKMGLRSIDFSSHGKVIAIGGWRSDLQLWDLEKEQPIDTLIGHTGSLYSVCYSPDGKTLASGSEDGTVKLWDAVSGELKTTLTGMPGKVHSVAFSPDGTILATVCSNGIIKLWRAATEEQVLSQSSP